MMSKIFRKPDGSSVVKGKNGKISGNLPAQHKQPKSAPSLPKKAGSPNSKGKATKKLDAVEVAGVAMMGEYFTKRIVGEANRGEWRDLAETRADLEALAEGKKEGKQSALYIGAAKSMLELVRLVEPVAMQNSRSSGYYCGHQYKCDCRVKLTVSPNAIPETFGKYMRGIYAQEMVEKGVDADTASEIVAFMSRDGYLSAARWNNPHHIGY